MGYKNKIYTGFWRLGMKNYFLLITCQNDMRYTGLNILTLMSPVSFSF